MHALYHLSYSPAWDDNAISGNALLKPLADDAHAAMMTMGCQRAVSGAPSHARGPAWAYCLIMDTNPSGRTPR